MKFGAAIVSPCPKNKFSAVLNREGLDGLHSKAPWERRKVQVLDESLSQEGGRQHKELRGE